MQEKNVLTTKDIFIDLMSDGHTYDEVCNILCSEPHLIPVESLLEWYKDPEVLKEIIESGSNKIGQVWGSMWKNIKRQAALGSIPHSKLLIEHVQNSKSVALSKLQFFFEDFNKSNG